MDSFYGVWNQIELRIITRKKAIRLITNSSYTAHTTPLFRTRLTKDTRYV